MIFGKSKNQTKEEKEIEIELERTGLRHFAWFPTRLHSGQYVWLDYYWSYADCGINRNGEKFIWSNSPEDYHPIRRNFIDASSSHIKPYWNAEPIAFPAPSTEWGTVTHVVLGSGDVIDVKVTD